jgi:hypothetical protein
MHPFLTATREAATSWICTPDGRLSPQTAPGIAEVRVSRAQLERALELLDAVAAECEARGRSRRWPVPASTAQGSASAGAAS